MIRLSALRTVLWASLYTLSISLAYASEYLGARDDMHFPLHARGTNTDGSLPLYKNAHASIEDRINDLLPRMTIEEKVAQLCVPSFSRNTPFIDGYTMQDPRRHRWMDEHVRPAR